MANRYENPLAAQFINTYTPIPFQEMVAAGQMKQQRYDQASNAMDSAIGAIDEITAIPNSADELRAKEYSDKMRTLRDKYVTKDLSDPFVQREMSNELHNTINKEDIKHIQESYQGYVNYNKMLADNAQKGVDTPTELIQNFTGYDSRQVGVFTGTPSIYKDPMPETKEFFNDLKSDSLGSFREKIDGVETGRVYTLSGVTVDRILKHADENISAFTKLPSIQQMVAVARKRGDDRSAEVIAKDYVRAHAKEWAHSTKDNFAYDPYYRASASGNDKTIPEPIEQKGLNGEDASTSKSQNKRYWDNKETTLSEQAANATNEIDKNKALNELQVIKDARAKFDTTRNAKIESTYDIGLREIYSNAIEALTTKEGMSKEEAAKFVTSLIQNRETPGDYKETIDNVTLALQSTPGELFRSFRKGLTEDAVKDKITNTIIKKTPALFYSSIKDAASSLFGEETSDNIKRASNDMQKSVEAIAKSWNNVSKNFDTANNKGEVVKSIFNSLNELDKQIGTFEKENSQNITNELNKTLPNQETYTLLNNDYTVDSSGRVQYDGLDGKKHSSAIGQTIKDFAKEPGNYMSNFKDDKNLSNSKKTLTKIKSALDASMDIQVYSINDLPDKDGNLKATVSIISKNKQGDKVQGKPMEIMLPANIYKNKENFLSELNSIGKDNLAFNISYHNQIENEITSYPWHSKNEQIINLGGGTLKIVKAGNKFSVSATIPARGISDAPVATGLNYNELPHRVRDIMFNLTRQTKK